uniref:Ig-like domain-containing protein n=1 Tax=Echeneis naucrates TaxID=173247 RepID=A0A665TU90_ECHNA
MWIWTVSFGSVASFKVAEGGVASLSCQYSVKRFGLSRVCWGRSCGTFWCNNILIQTDDHGVISKVSDRYRLTGDVLDGQMDLDIVAVRRTDSGPYCCRVDIDGIFNDKKVIMNLRVVKGESTEIRGPGPGFVSGSDSVRPGLPPQPRSPVLQDSLPSLSLQINVPVLSLSVSLLMVLTSVTLFLNIKAVIPSFSFSFQEPPHIIYEIRMRRPVQENIYTLD